jgi:ABC-type transporter Mla subunit MlaD
MSLSIDPQPTAEAGLPTADIIPFPARPKPQEQRPEERLVKAMQKLNAALAEQRVAIAGWREALGQLKVTTTGLGESLQRYRSNLGQLSGRVSVLHDQARSLEKWADSVVSE